MSQERTILFVDDERQISAMTTEFLKTQGYQVYLIHSSEEGLRLFKEQKFDLCVLDIKMPMKDGYSLAQDIRQLNDTMPFIFLTGKAENEDIVRGLELGADDYITKPYSLQELHLRIKNILKRSQQIVSNPSSKVDVQLGAYRFNPRTRDLILSNNIVKLTNIECQLLQMFYTNQDKLITREQILIDIWGDDNMLRGPSLNVYMSKLRRYVKNDPNIEFLNLHGYGYKLVIRAPQ